MEIKKNGSGKIDYKVNLIFIKLKATFVALAISYFVSF